MKHFLLAAIFACLVPGLAQALTYCQVDSCYDQSDSVWTDSCSVILGDVNNSGTVDGIDVIYLRNYFTGGSAPIPEVRCFSPSYPPPFYLSADVNGSCSVNGLDLTYLVNFLKGPPYPDPVCCQNYSGCKAYYP